MEARTQASSSAVIAGATGAVGRQVLTALVASPSFTKITTIGRRPAEAAGEAGFERVVQHVADVFAPATYESTLVGHDAAFCTVGVGEPSKVTKEEVRRVDVEAVVTFAEACRRSGVRHFTVMTSVGASARSGVLYLRMKAEVEDRVRALGFERASVFRPSLLVTPKNRYGVTQGLLLAVYPKLDWMLPGSLRKYRSVRVEELGRAMVANAEREPAPAEERVFEIHEWDAFDALAARA